MRYRWKDYDLGVLGHGSHRLEGFLLSGLEGLDLRGHLFVSPFSKGLYFCVR